MVHKNSIKSKMELKPGGAHNRVLRVHHQMNRPLTDREVKNIGRFEDMNCVRPRINELCHIDYGPRLEECGSTICVETKRTVRLTRLILQGRLF